MDKFMKQALISARKAFELNEVPVGCVFVRNMEIIAEACNEVNKTKNATRHAEMVCIDTVLDQCHTNGWNPSDVFATISVVVTVEPCIMCAAALVQLGIKEILFGCGNDRFGGQTVVNVFDALNSNITIRSGIEADAAMALLKEFYKGENPSAPDAKRKKKIHRHRMQSEKRNHE